MSKVKELISSQSRGMNLHRSRRNTEKETATSISEESEIPRFLEVCIVADENFISHHGHRDAEEYLLTIMNMASNYWHDASIGTPIDVTVVRVILLEKQNNEINLNIVSKAEDTLRNFCKWQTPLNPSDPTHPSHYDISILVTRHDLCENDIEGCNLLGLAFTATACNTYGKNCAIIEDSGLISGVVAAHEIGHILGCAHDPEDSGCPEELPNGSHSIMSSHMQLNSNSWSSCSRSFVADFMSSGIGDCLMDEPPDHNYPIGNIPPGAVYSIEQQCRFIFGDEYIACPIGGDEICKKLWCKVPGSKECVSRDSMVADGSPCGSYKWCFKGDCIKEGERPNSVAGGWSQWSNWSDCTRTCGGGVTRRQRQCNNPLPQNGGAFCLGPKSQYSMCNIQDCEENVTRFRELQCSQHNNKPFRGEKYSWTPAPPPENDPNPCALYCVNEKRIMAKLEPRVKDGTRCRPGSKDTCIHGICKRVGCDWQIDSDMDEDICGVCGGDGTHCKIIKETFSQKKGSGYIMITTMPEGSKNIDIKEQGPGENTLAIGKPDGTIYFNDQYVELPSGEYTFGGVRGTYTKPEDNREEIHIKGPLKEELSLFMCFFNDDNKGVEYYYIIPTTEATRTPSYHWEHLDWSPCTARCGGGTQISKATCVEEMSGKVKTEYCKDVHNKPEPLTRSCNNHKCRTRWKAWKWGVCSGCLYKTGYRIRQVECVMESPKFGDGDEIIVNGATCKGNPPHSWELCNSFTPCSELEIKSVATGIDEDLLKNGYYDYCYNLEGIEELVRSQVKGQVQDCHWKSAIYDMINKYDLNSDFNNEDIDFEENVKLRKNRKVGNKWKPGEIAKDKVELSEVRLEVAKLSPCNVDLNLTEEDFENEGDTIPSYIPQEIMNFRGREAVVNILKLKKTGAGDNLFEQLNMEDSHLSDKPVFQVQELVATTRSYIPWRNASASWLGKRFSWGQIFNRKNHTMIIPITQQP